LAERGFDSYSPSLVGKGLGVRFFALYFTQLRTAIVDKLTNGEVKLK
jgi:hypothetical protein